MIDFGFAGAVPASPLPFPRHAHIPGSGSEPDWGPLEAAKESVPNMTTCEQWTANGAHIYGFALLRNGYYWEAHEIWEPVWLASAPNSRERILLRGLIQLANACLKAHMGMDRAAQRLLREVHLEFANLNARQGEVLMGVDVHQAIAAIDRTGS